MTKVSCEFVNEVGSPISMEVTVEEGKTVIVNAIGPNSTVNHTWTKLEAMWLVELITNPRLWDPELKSNTE